MGTISDRFYERYRASGRAFPQGGCSELCSFSGPFLIASTSGIGLRDEQFGRGVPNLGHFLPVFTSGIGLRDEQFGRAVVPN